MARTRLALDRLDERFNPASAASALTAFGAADGTVTAVRPDGGTAFQARPFGADFTGGVRVAVGDLTGDGVPDIAAAAGPGGGPAVKLYNGVDGSEVSSFFAFEEGFCGGVFVALGDVDRDGRDDLVLTPDQGGGPRVRVLSGDGLGVIADFFGIDDPAFRGGARAAAADLDADGAADVVVAAGFGGGPRVAAFSGSALAAGRQVKLFGDRFVVTVHAPCGSSDGLAPVTAWTTKSRTPRPCWRHVATTVSIRSTNRLPRSLSVPKLVFRQQTA
jgi:hypothetical protein